MNIEVLMEDAFAAYIGHEWDKVDALSRQILNAKPLKPWMEGAAWKMLAHSKIAFSMNQDDAKKRSYRQTAVEEARKSISAYGREAQPEARNLSESYCVLGLAQNLLGFAMETMDEKIRQNKEAIASTEKALQLHPGNREAQEDLQKFRNTESVYATAEQEPKAKSGGCFVATAACGDPFAPEVITLSAFRDDVLLRTRLGRSFVRLYYIASPPIAAIVARSSALRRIVMAALVRPAAHTVAKLRNDCGSRGR